MIENLQNPEKAIAVSVVKKGTDRVLALEHLDELEFLAETAGAEVVEKVYQELQEINKSTVVGKGKLEEIKAAIEESDITLIIFDDDLSPAQNKNLENELKVKVIDRSGLILDIFTKRARTTEAMTQVELAQLQYIMPRLTKMWTHLSKQYGGIRTKGPGETQIETDRRMVRIKIQKLKEKLENFEVQKQQQRKSRNNFPKFALVGYTNVGKSTLMNAITQADVYIEDKLFATLDTTVRGFNLPSGKLAMLSDTVGFIRKLPTHLIASFRSTLSEARESDVLLIVIDITHPYFRDHIQVVEDTLNSLNIHFKPKIYIFNKIDCVEDKDLLPIVEREYPNSIFISAKRGININYLLEKMQELYFNNTITYKTLLPYSEMKLVGEMYNIGEIITRDDIDTGVGIEIKIQPDYLEFFKNVYSKFIVQV